MFASNGCVTLCAETDQMRAMVKRGRPGVAFKGRIPNRIREIRERRGITQQNLAKALDTDFQGIGKLERGENRLRVDQLLPIAKALGCHPGELVPGILNLTPAQSDMLRAFDALSPEDQERAVRMIAALAAPAKKSA